MKSNPVAKYMNLVSKPQTVKDKTKYDRNKRMTKKERDALGKEIRQAQHDDEMRFNTENPYED